jgi:steroid delta-isomerase-like uncharacterized protein
MVSGQTEARSVCEQIAARYNAHDLDGLMALYADDIELQTPDLAEPLRGKAAVRQYWEVQLQAFPDAHVELIKLVADESSFADDGVVTGTNTGAMVQPNGESLPPTGKALRLPFGEVAELASGRVRRHRLYWDQLLAFGQLGLMEMPQATPADT